MSIDPSRPVRVGVLGAGNVGAAFVRLLGRHPGLEVTGVLVRDPERPRDLGSRAVRVTTEPEAALDGADVVVELLGGIDRPTELMALAAERGARLVTANKAALAERWDAWGPWVRAGRVGFEAAVMAGTPVVGPLAGALRGSRLRSLEALLNGTCSYLLQRLGAGVGFDEALAEAQRLGYAEADPSLDVDGIDAAHKLTVLGRLCADPDLAWSDVRTQVRGVRGLTPEDVRSEREAGRRLLLVAALEPDGGGGWRASVGPRGVPADHPLARLGDGRGALVYRGDAVGEVWLAGPGAGADTTASAVLADVLEAAAGRPGPTPSPERVRSDVDDAVAHVPAWPRPS